MQKVFGLASLSPVRLVDKELDAVAAAAVDEARAAIEESGVRPTFKVEARRADKRFPLTSPEIAREVGAAVIAATGLPVDVHHPALTLGVEIGFEHAYVWGRTAAGPGGLPVGSSGRADLLLSGGIDSPVAGWMAMKRGLHLAATYFHSFPFTGDKTKDKVARLARRLAAWQGGELALRVVPFTDAQKALREAGDPRLAVVLYRRMMMRVAERLAQKRNALALVTGEALAQVASQTLENLAVIGASTSMPILRPLIAHDKLDTIAVARRIDTYELSIEPYEDCCQLFVPEHPETRAKLSVVEAIEQRVDIPALVERCVGGAETIDCRP
jgi:thiamine biosynthesis protein ThiI